MTLYRTLVTRALLELADPRGAPGVRLARPLQLRFEPVERHLPVLHRYLRLRGRALGIDQLDYADLYCPLGDAPPRRWDTAAARQAVREGMRPLGGGDVTQPDHPSFRFGDDLLA